MSQYLEKIITSKSDFEDGIVQSNLDYLFKDGYAQLKFDKFNNESKNSNLSTATGGGSVTEANDKITLTRGAPGVTSIVILRSTKRLLKEFEFMYSFKVVALTKPGANYDYGFFGIGTYYWNLTPPPWNYATSQVYCYQDLAGAMYILYIDGATTYYWNPTSNLWQTGAVSAYAGALNTLYKIRAKKTETDLILTIYDSSDNILITATLSLSVLSYEMGGYWMVGDVHFATVPSTTFTIEVTDLFGLYSENLVGTLTNIIDMEIEPLRKGKYIEVLDESQIYDITLPRLSSMNAYGLRSAVNNTMFSESFVMSVTKRVTGARICCSKTGTITAGKKIWLEIWSDDGTTKPYALFGGYVSAKKEAEDIITTEKIYEHFYFNIPVSLQKGITYHLVIRGDYDISGVNHINIWYDPAGGFADGVPHDFDGSVWANNTINIADDWIFGIKLYTSGLIERKIGYADWQAWVTLTSKADFEGYNQVQNQIDTATIPGTVILAWTGAAYFATGYIQNDIDLGQVPDNYCTLSAIYFERQSIAGNTSMQFEVASSDDGIAYSGFTVITVNNGKGDLTSLGLHRYWRVKITLNTANTAITPELYAWTIDSFSSLENMNSRYKVLQYRYLKIEETLGTSDYEDSPELDSYTLKFRENYELYAKKINYRVDSRGIKADMALSSV